MYYNCAYSVRMDIRRNKVVGEVLGCIRREHELTQSDVAKRVGYSQSAISKTESGERQLPFYESFLFCAAMGEEPHTFVDRVYIRLSEEGLVPSPKEGDESAQDIWEA